MNADPEVRRHVGPLLTFEQAAAWLLNYQDDLHRYGYGFWAVEVRACWRGPRGATVTPPKRSWRRCGGSA
jgi:hypothetical protein